MTQTDTLIKALAFNNEVRIYTMTATELVAKAQRRHDTWQTSTAVLGRTLIGTALMAANLKGNDLLSVVIQGSGPVGRIVADGDARGHVRGFVSNPHVALELNQHGKIDVSGGVGLPGMLTVSKRIEDGEPFSGQVELVSGELGEDFTYYMAVSEQTPSAIGVSVLVSPDESVLAAGGFMIQMLPGASEETIETLEKRLENLPRFSDLIDEGKTAEELLEVLVGDTETKILDELPLSFACPCSKAGFGERLLALGVDDLTEMIEEDHGAEVICHYCNQAYDFSEDELIAIRQEIIGESNV